MSCIKVTSHTPSCISVTAYTPPCINIYGNVRKKDEEDNEEDKDKVYPDAPTLSVQSEAPENTTIHVDITNFETDGYYDFIIGGGVATLYENDSFITWDLPNVDVDTDYEIIAKVRVNGLTSEWSSIATVKVIAEVVVEMALEITTVNGSIPVLNENIDDSGLVYTKDDDTVIVTIVDYDPYLTYYDLDSDANGSTIDNKDGTIAWNMGDNDDGVDKSIWIYSVHPDTLEIQYGIISIKTMEQSVTPILSGANSMEVGSTEDYTIENYDADSTYNITVESTIDSYIGTFVVTNDVISLTASYTYPNTAIITASVINPLHSESLPIDKYVEYEHLIGANQYWITIIYPCGGVESHQLYGNYVKDKYCASPVEGASFDFKTIGYSNDPNFGGLNDGDSVIKIEELTLYVKNANASPSTIDVASSSGIIPDVSFVNTTIQSPPYTQEMIDAGHSYYIYAYASYGVTTRINS